MNWCFIPHVQLTIHFCNIQSIFLIAEPKHRCQINKTPRIKYTFPHPPEFCMNITFFYLEYRIQKLEMLPNITEDLAVSLKFSIRKRRSKPQSLWSWFLLSHKIFQLLLRLRGLVLCAHIYELSVVRLAMTTVSKKQYYFPPCFT